MSGFGPRINQLVHIDPAKPGCFCRFGSTCPISAVTGEVVWTDFTSTRALFNQAYAQCGDASLIRPQVDYQLVAFICHLVEAAWVV